jgi:hypothetical protein
MPKRLGLAAAVALVIALASVTLASASSPKPKGADGHAVQVLQLTTEPAQQADLDLGEEGFSQGDQQVFTDNVFRDGKKVGEFAGFAQITFAAENRFSAQLVTTLTLPRGSITLQGAFSEDPAVGPTPALIAITGGTGAYRTAHGQARVEVTETGSNLTLRLIL